MGMKRKVSRIRCVNQTVPCGVGMMLRPFRACYHIIMPISQGVALGCHVRGLSGRTRQTRIFASDRRQRHVRGLSGRTRQTRIFASDRRQRHVRGLSGRTRQTRPPSRWLQWRHVRFVKCRPDGLVCSWTLHDLCFDLTPRRGSDISAQGNALGKSAYGICTALKGRNKSISIAPSFPGKTLSFAKRGQAGRPVPRILGNGPANPCEGLAGRKHKDRLRNRS